MRMREWGVLTWIGLGLAGCGYGFQNSHSELLEKQGIHSIYVSPAVNKSYQPGIDHTVYNALIHQIAMHRRVRLAQHPEDSDAILTVVVADASVAQGAQSTASNLNPIGTGSSSVVVATSYVANLGCTLSLARRGPGRVLTTIWTSTIGKSKGFPANNQLGLLGDTSALINDSEFDRALSDLADDMASDAHESMLDMF